MKNLTDVLIEDYFEKDLPLPSDLKMKVQNNILSVCGLKPLPYPLRDLQIISILYFMRKNKDVFCVLPTGYGKTMIAVCNALYMWKIFHKKTIFIGIYKALTAEQFETFNKMGIQTIIDDGDHKDLSGDYETEEWTIACFTPERFDSLLCNEEKRLILMDEVGLIVTDEVQNIDDEGRGHRMENYITICRSQYPELRFNYLSATIGNPDELAKWTDSKLIRAKPQDRPVPLELNYNRYNEIMYTWNDSIPDVKANFELRLELLSNIIDQDPDSTYLIFVTSRPRCKQIAQYLCGTGYTPNLDSMVEEYGLAYHNADLSMDERQYVEKAFREGTIKKIVCTPTLAAGVNLPADHAIIFDCEQYNILTGSEIIGANRIQQSIGRAGRPGLSEKGFANIITANRIFDTIVDRSTIPSIIQSQLKFRLHEKILQWVAGGICNTLVDCLEICRFALAHITEEEAIAGVDWLKAFGFITESDSNTYRVTTIGKLTNQMYIMPETVVYWTSQIKSVQNVNSLKELYIRFGSTPQYAGIVTVRQEDSKIIDYATQEMGKFFPQNKILENHLCFCCSKQFECNIKQFTTEKCDSFKDNMLKIISNEVLKAYFLTFYDDLAEKYLPKKYDTRTKQYEVKHLPISFGDRYQLKMQGNRIFTAASVIFYREEEISQNLSILAAMCETGTLQQELVELCKLKQIGIAKARKLVDAGIKTVGDFRSVEIEVLSKALSSSIKSAQKLREVNGM